MPSTPLIVILIDLSSCSAGPVLVLLPVQLMLPESRLKGSAANGLAACGCPCGGPSCGGGCWWGLEDGEGGLLGLSAVSENALPHLHRVKAQQE